MREIESPSCERLIATVRTTEFECTSYRHLFCSHTANRYDLLCPDAT